MKKKKRERKREKKRSSMTLILIIILVLGLSLMLYPTISNRWNTYHQTRTLIRHAENVAKLSKEECEKLRSAAVKYNESLRGDGSRWHLTEEDRKLYNSLLVFDETEIISSIEIPKIKVSLPIFHGTGKNVLQTAIGHLEGSSLPVGGKGTHCVLSGHRGLPSARLFTDLDKLAEGDIFILYTLDQTLTYEIDQIRVLEPTDLSTLTIDPQEDYCTIFTCTPYGINTHRLMLRGHRVENEGNMMITAEALQVEEITVALVIGIPLLIIIFIIAMFKDHKSKTPMRIRLKQEG